MTDDERQAQALRQQLNRELTGVQATAQARERLIRTTAAQTRAGRASTRAPRPLRPILALPLAGALVATVIAGAVVVPTFLRTETEPAVPAGGGVQPPTVQPPTVQPQPKPSSPAQTPAVQAVPSQTASESNDDIILRLTADPKEPAVDQRFLLGLAGIPARHGNITVNWGDRSVNTKISSSCADRARPTAAEPVKQITHSYSQAGSYRVKATVNRCESETSAKLTIIVKATVSPSPVRRLG